MADSRSSTFIVAGQIAVALVGAALGAVLTLMIVLDRPQPDTRPAQPPPPRPAMVVPKPEAAPLPWIPPPSETIPSDHSEAPPVADVAPPPRRSAAAAGYAVQAGAFQNRAAADRLAAKLTAQGQSAAVYARRDAGGHVLNLVRLTQIFASRAAAAERGLALERDLGIKTLVAPAQGGERP